MFWSRTVVGFFFCFFVRSVGDVEGKSSLFSEESYHRTKIAMDIELEPDL